MVCLADIRYGVLELDQIFFPGRNGSTKAAEIKFSGMHSLLSTYLCCLLEQTREKENHLTA